MDAKKENSPVAFNWKEPHHGYIGVIMVIIGAVFYWSCGYTKTGSGFIAIGFMITADEAWQIYTKNQLGGPIHRIFVLTLYKIPIIKKFTDWASSYGKEKK